MIVPTRSHTDHRLARLEQGLAAGEPAALDDFWKAVVADGSPLMEPLDGDETRTLVTFVWRDPGDTRNVLVLFYSAPTQDGFDDYRMRQVPQTDVWFASYILPSDLRTTYLLSVNDSLVPYQTYADVLSRIPGYRPDPLNPQEVTIQDDLRVSVLELPRAPKQPWNIARRGVPKGSNHMHLVDSEILGTKHHVTVHTPPGYTTDGEPYHVLLLLDGWAYFNFAATPTALDNLLYARRTPPFVLVMHSNTDQEVRARELPCHEPFAEFLERELMPFLHDNYHLTSKPEQTYIAGSCYGGLAAVYVAFKLPHLFGNAISQSGSFWWPGHTVPGTGTEWLTDRFEASPRLPIRVSLEVGALEAALVDFDQLKTNRRLRDVLRDRGYDVDYSEYMGGHDMITWRGTLVQRLLALTAREGAE